MKHEKSILKNYNYSIDNRCEKKTILLEMNEETHPLNFPTVRDLKLLARNHFQNLYGDNFIFHSPKCCEFRVIFL